jgi:hypothetical protein
MLGDDIKLQQATMDSLTSHRNTMSLLSICIGCGSPFSALIIWILPDTDPHLAPASATCNLHSLQSHVIESIISISTLQQLHTFQPICLQCPPQDRDQGRVKEHHQTQIPSYIKVHVPLNIQCHSQSQNHNCGIAAYVTFIPLPYDLLLMNIQKTTLYAPDAFRPSPSTRSSKSRPSTLQSHLN